IEELLRNMLDLEQRPPGEDGRRRERSGGFRARRCSGQARERDGRSGVSSGSDNHDVTSLAVALLRVRWPVRVRKTSSRRGWPRASSLTPMPARASSVTAEATCAAATDPGRLAGIAAVSAAGSAPALTATPRDSVSMRPASVLRAGSTLMLRLPE